MKVDYNKFLVKPKSTVIHAFDSGGVPYFKFESLDKLPIKRFNAFREALRYEEMKVDATYLKGFIEGVKECLNSGKLYDAMVLLSHMEERVQNITDVELLYHMASILYFDYSENPNDFDQKHASVKIALWQKDDIDDFFLKSQLYPQNLQFNSIIRSLAEYTQSQRKQVLQSIRFLLSNLPEKKDRDTLISSLRSAEASYKKLLSWTP